MDRMIINGGRALTGAVKVSGAKNAALPILASTLLGGECVVTNVPRVVDVATMCRLIGMLGASVTVEDHRVAIRIDHLASAEAPYDLVRKMRASVLVLGPLLARWGEAVVSLPGGCAIGTRPVDLHLSGFTKLGADIAVEHGYIRAKAKRLKGANIYLDVPTVTGTENLLMAACLAEGATVIENAAREPEVIDLAESLVKRGAKIFGAGTDTITIEGVRELRGADHEVIPDRIEAGTFLVAGAMTCGDVCVESCQPKQMDAVTAKLRESGAELLQGKESVRVKMAGRPRGVDVKTFAYPGFPTDMQAQIMALMAVATGTSVITETIFESRFIHVPELCRMGADIKVDGHHAVVNGKLVLTGAPVMASDLRASAGLVLAGLAAEGSTEVGRIYHLDRGYEGIEDKLRGLGADIERVKDHPITPGRPR